MTDNILTCACGARGDAGELTEHAMAALHAPDNPHPHGFAGEPDRVRQAREGESRRAETRRRLAAAAGVTLDELREVL